MPILMRPDVGAAILQYLKDSEDITDPSIVGSNIFLGWPEKDRAITIPTNATNFINLILIEAKRGGPGDIGLGLIAQRVTFKCYGVNKLQASNIWRVLDYYLMKPDGRTKTSFTKASTIVNKIEQESGPNELTDVSAANWPFVEASYIVTYVGIKKQ